MRILEYQVTAEEAGKTVKQLLQSRAGFGKKQISRLKFRPDGLRLNGEQCRTSRILKEGDVLLVRLDSVGKTVRDRAAFSEDGPHQEEGTSFQNETGAEGCFEEPPAPCIPAILYEDRDLLAVYKPGGISLHPGPGHSRDTLWNQIITLQEMRGEIWTPRIIGRLDRDTSGIILLAKTTEAAAAMARQRQTGALKKIYYAETEGIFPGKSGIIDLPLEKDPASLNRMRIAETAESKSAEGVQKQSVRCGNSENAQKRSERSLFTEDTQKRSARSSSTEKVLKAVTHYRVLRERNGKSILEIELEQGRTHQIRVHMAAIGHPLAGDVLYHPDLQQVECFRERSEEPGKPTGLHTDAGEERELHLHAGRMRFQTPFTGKYVEITAPLPGWLKGEKEQ